MTIRRNLSDLPAAQRDEGNPPNANPKFVTQLAEAWYQSLLDHDEGSPIPADHPIRDVGPYRASYSSKRCDRQLMYALRGDDKTNPPTIADQWRFSIGHMVHAGIQKVMDQVHGGNVLVEELVDLTPAGIPGFGLADLIVLEEQDHGASAPAEVCVVEYKTINGFGFKMAATTFRGPPEGPRSGHALQAAMVAVARDIPYFAVGYFSLENLSPSMAGDFANGEIGRFTAEWRFKTEDWVPLVNHEAIRIQSILADIEAGTLTPRRLDDPEYPAGAVVDEPDRKGRWTATDEDGIVVGTGTYWGCQGYCPHYDRCVDDGATPVTIGSAS